MIIDGSIVFKRCRFQCHRFVFRQGRITKLIRLHLDEEEKKRSLLEIGSPRRSEDVDGFGEDIVVDETRVDGEESHEKDDISSSEEDCPDFLCSPFVLKSLFFEDHPEGEERKKNSMSRISEHHREEKRKSDQDEGHWIDFSISGHTVGIDQILKSLSEFIQSMKGRWLFHTDQSMNDRRHFFSSRSFVHRQSNIFESIDRRPTFGNERFLR